MSKNESFRILIFGETGTGKTSACNAVSGQCKPTSNRAIGVTFQSQTYLPFIRNDKSYVITDTVGLNEGDKGMVKATDAIKNLLELVRKSESGYNLFVQVARGRITKSLCDNYKFFVDVVAQNKIPVILIVTGCENTEPMSLWEDENKHYFEKQGLDYKNIIATCFAETQIPDFKARYDRLREESKEKMMVAVDRYALEQPVKLYKKGKGVVSFFKRIWNGLCSIVDAQEWKITINKSLLELLMRLGFTEKEAKDLEGK